MARVYLSVCVHVCVCGMWSWNRGAYIIKVFRTVVVQNARVRAAANFLAMSHVRGEARRGESPSFPSPSPVCNFRLVCCLCACFLARSSLSLALRVWVWSRPMLRRMSLSPTLSPLSLSLSFCVTEETRTLLMTKIMTMIVGAECENNWWMRRRLPQWGFG